MLASVILSSLLVGVLFLIVFLKNSTDENNKMTVREVYGDKALELFLACIALLWILPYGAIAVLPLALLVSVMSPAGRQAWSAHGKFRTYAITAMIVILLMGGLVPTSTPKSPESWGQPLATENPNAPLYPSGQQYTWLRLPTDGGLNVEIIQSLSIRTPHQYGKFSAASSTFSIADLFNMQESRLDQAIQLLDQQIVFDIDEDEMMLETINDKRSHTYDIGTESYKLDIRLYELRSLTLTSDPNGFKVGEVFCAAESTWSGELNILVVVRPVGHTGLESDRYAEGLTVQWISAD